MGSMRFWGVVLIALLGLACKRSEPPGRAYACRCPFLTDTDERSEQPVTVCAADREAAEHRAVGCAQTGAPATVEGCRCEPRPGEPCPAGGCQLAERR